ncbi:M20/M25/M40 family metallo-hydrolase [Actinomadura bangladeshensis]|uniref:M20/M25/M40 family metallo-hydrolase n=1 Tax=Actinomadura bangladeshensis TaxID=453573 RepID=A0A4R4PC39_9ACTN|nr:M20/M25/M40 family metallo-hydrolase [Actinomadura bangladeshensis]TDC18680.1 M20/M25/M40 family metallo-hydrolase [Actinomadura bangladeshensis]
MRRAALATLTGLSLAAATVAAMPAQAAAPSQSKLARLVTLKNVRHHQLNLQKIADANGGNRAAGLPGNKITIKYIADQLKRAGYTPTVQNFAFDFWQENSAAVFAETAPEQKTFAPDTDFATMQYSGSGDVTAAATPVDPGATGLGSGCEADDFAGFPAGHIALIQRGGCFFSLKTDNAIAAGASAVVIYQLPDQPGPVAGTLTTPYDIPVIGPTNAVGRALVDQANNGGVTLRVKTDTLNQKREAANVLADTGRGRADNVVVVGAHNDSVTAGPGINDDGSGTATLLEMAKQIGKLGPKVRNQVRFAFWGAEEEGLLGSQYYVDNLPQAERDKVALMLDFDMLASPNYVNFVYDGDDSEGRNNVEPPAGSGAIEKAFNDYFASRNLHTDATAFDGRSDYNAFITAGIPAGGIFTGAEGIKTPEQAAIYGGTAGVAYDPCYHSACDRYDNVDLTGFDHMIDATAAVTQLFAHSTLTVNGNEFARRAPAQAAKRTVPDEIGNYKTR